MCHGNHGDMLEGATKVDGACISRADAGPVITSGFNSQGEAVPARAGVPAKLEESGSTIAPPDVDTAGFLADETAKYQKIVDFAKIRE